MNVKIIFFSKLIVARDSLEENTFQILDMTKRLTILLWLVFVAAAQHIDSATRGGDKVGETIFVHL